MVKIDDLVCQSDVEHELSGVDILNPPRSKNLVNKLTSHNISQHHSSTSTTSSSTPTTSSTPFSSCLPTPEMKRNSFSASPDTNYPHHTTQKLLAVPSFHPEQKDSLTVNGVHCQRPQQQYNHPMSPTHSNQYGNNYEKSYHPHHSLIPNASSTCQSLLPSYKSNSYHPYLEYSAGSRQKSLSFMGTYTSSPISTTPPPPYPLPSLDEARTSSIPCSPNNTASTEHEINKITDTEESSDSMKITRYTNDQLLNKENDPECPICHRQFKKIVHLRTHVRIHENKKPFQCKICLLSFLRKHDLQRHEKIHAGIKPFACHRCGKAFARKDGLRRHENMDPSVQKFRCIPK